MILQSFRFLIAPLVAALGLAALEVPAAEGARAEPKVQLSETTRGLAHAGTVRSTRARPFRLEAPTDLAAAGLGESRKGAPLKVGVGRDIAALREANAAAGALDWQTQPDGSLVAAVSIGSATAASIRAALRFESLPAGTTLRFQSPNEGELFEFDAEDVRRVLALNEAAGEQGPDARLYWSPLIEGDTVVIEIQLAPGVAPSELRVAIPQLSHLVTSATKDFQLVSKAASCEVDAMCSQSTWGTQMNAVARMVFSSGGSTFVCSGTLLADQNASSNVPYFLSANHCISGQSAASTLSTFWFYRSAACNSASLGDARQLAGGAALLYNSANTDTAFLRLTNTPPSGAVYAGWYAAGATALGAAATGLHHPRGEWLKISKGNVDGYLTCTAPTSGSFTCKGASATGATFYAVTWSSGITEPGSSGSGLFRSDGLLVGQLYGGGSACGGEGGDIYGRFDVAYNAGINQWLGANTLTVIKSGTGGGTVTSVPAGINCGATCAAGFPSGAAVTLSASPAAGSAFSGWSGACSGTGACVVTMSGARSVTATFTQGTGTLAVTRVGSGSGTVASSPGGIDCGTSCSATYPLGTVVSLSATAPRDAPFMGWSGACSGTGTCTVTINAAVSVQATFGNRAASTTSLATSANPAPYGNAVTLTATVGGTVGVPTGTVIFLANGAPIANCTAQPMAAGVATCSASGFAVGTHSITATYSGNTAYNASTSAALAQLVAPGSAALVNLSTRGKVLTGSDVLIGGFVIGGSVAKTVVLRARGPSLGAFGIANPLADPTVTLVRSADNAILAANDNWSSAPNAAQLAAAGLAPGHPLESALLVTLGPGAYTAIVSGVGGATGVGTFEVFELGQPNAPLVNLSTRGQILSGEDVMIGGFVIQGTSTQTVVVRARGPSLAAFGIPGTISNPALTLVRSADGAVLASNDNWASAANAAQLSASGFAPSNGLEAALLVTLPPGAYTAIVSGSGGATGVGTIEVFAQ